MWHRRRATKNTRAFNGLSQCGAGTEHDVVCYFDMSYNAYLGTRDDSVPKLRATRDPRLRYNHAIFTCYYVVRNLDQVVDLRAFSYAGLAECGAVDGCVCAYLYVILKDDDANLRDLVPHPFVVRREAEAIAPDDCASLKDDTIAYMATL